MKVCCVLRSGGDLTSTDVGLLQLALEKHLPGHELHCLSDVDVPCKRLPLLFNWPKWWAKMELFNPVIKGDLFYMDLDTVPVKDISHMVRASVDTVLSDFYYSWRMASGVMYLTEETRRSVWNEWITEPEEYMSIFDGDQKFLETTVLGLHARRWQMRFPGEVISFKRHMRPSPPFPAGPQLLEPPAKARIVCFHGTPRPRQVWHEEWIKEAWT